MSPSKIRRKKLETFLDDVDRETFATLMRDFMKESIMLTLKVDENRFRPDKKVISEAYYFLNELCDIIDPDITQEKT